MTSSTAAGLSTAEIDQIRESLTAGRKPKVMFTSHAGQIAGQIGQVVQLTDPSQSEEWLVVRFGRDELPFSPADLAIPPRGRDAKQAARPAPAAATNPLVDERAASATAPAQPSAPAAEADPGGSPRPVKRSAKQARASRQKGPAAMTVTLAYESGEWTVGAAQGSRTLAKPYVIRSAEALKMVSLLDVPGVQEAVEQIVNAELDEAQRRAEALRGELAEVEAKLAELRGSA